MKKRGVTVLFCFSFITLAAPFSVDAAPIVNQYDSYRQLSVVARNTRFTVDVVTINLANPRLKVKTLTGVNADCRDNCTVKPLKSYVDSGRGFAGVNGSYFCPADYASCGSEDGSFFWMVLNFRNGVFINKKQNRFNQGPLVTVDSSRQVNFYRETKDFNATTMGSGLTAAISNDPALVVNSKVVVDPTVLTQKQREVKSNRSGLGLKGSNIYVLVARKATVVDLAYLMKAMGMVNAMNLDGGGSSALWYRGEYRVSPGRNIPNALVFTEQ